MTQKTPLAISMGEPAGIGPDLLLAMFADRKILDLAPFLLFGNLSLFRARAKRLGLKIDLAEASPQDAADIFEQALPVFPVGTDIADRPGEPQATSAQAVLDAISGATGACLTRDCRALITAPIHKGVLNRAGFLHPGHTEYLAQLCAGGGEPPLSVMMLAHRNLRVVPLTIHIPLRNVAEQINTQMIVRKGRIVAKALQQQFGIETPKIAIAGLNPHAGEQGQMGDEDMMQIAPAVALLIKEGFNVVGPLPADTLFYPGHWQKYDVVLAMYHDQALIPIKALAFEEAVNITLGLPIIRTSPDHGSAFDLAGSGKASHKSFLAAIRLADKMSA